MSKTIKLVLAMAVCIYMVTFSQHADGANNCQQVLTAMQPCRNYLKQGGTVPDACCKGVDKLNTAATTPAMKKTYCECLQSQARSLGVKSEYASSLPQKCKVNVGYPISYNFKCSSIH